MASVTLAEAAKLQQNPLVAGVIETIVTVNPVYQVMPFDQIVGNALQYNKEKVIGGVDFVGIGGDASVNAIPAGAKTPAEFESVTTALKPLIGDAYVDHFIQTTMDNPNNQKAIQVASKAKGLAREFQDTMINGDEGSNPKSFDGLSQLVPAAQTLDQNSAVFSFEMLDELMSIVKAKDGQVDFFMMPDVVLRKYLTLLRALGGAGIGETVTLPNSTQVMAYRGVPMFRNDWIPVSGSPVKLTDIYAGCWDDGSRKVGVAGLTSSNQSGIFVNDIGEAESTNDTITRLRFYAGFAVFSELGIARASEVRVN